MTITRVRYRRSPLTDNYYCAMTRIGRNMKFAVAVVGLIRVTVRTSGYYINASNGVKCRLITY